MGKPRFLHPGLIALLLLAACSAEPDSLLVATKAPAGGGGDSAGAGYGPSSLDAGSRCTVSGRVVYAGKPAKPSKLDLSPGWCTDNRPDGILSETFLVNADGTLKGCIVYIKYGLNNYKSEVPSEPVVLDQRGCQYVPHVVTVRTGQPLLIKSSDATAHNVHGAAGPNGGWNLPMQGVGALAPMKLMKAEIAKKVVCDIHSWMRSYVAVLPHPFHAITGDDGTFRIENVPPGKYLLAVWHEELGEIAFNEEEGLVLQPGEDKTVDLTYGGNG